MKTGTLAERPELLEEPWERTGGTFAECNAHGDVLQVYWSRLTTERPDFL